MPTFRAKRSRLRASRRGFSLALLVVAVLAALVVGGIVYWSAFRPGEAKGPGPITNAVARGPYEFTVMEQGEVESSRNIELRCEVKSRNSGGITILDVALEGAMVNPGDVLVRLDSSALDQERIQQQISVNTSEALVVQATNTLEAAKIARREYLEGTFRQEEQVLLGGVFVAEQNLRSAQLAFESAQRLAAKGLLTPLQLEGQQAAVENARNELETAKVKLEVLRKYTREKMLKTLESDIATAQAKLSSEESVLNLEKEKLRDVEDQIAKCTIKAPTAGQVVYANKYNTSSRSGTSAEFVVEAGAMVREQQPIIRLPDSHEMQVKALISEARVTLVRPGQPVTIRVDALKDEMLTGEVTKVNQYAEPGSWSSGSVKKYAALIRITNPPPALRSGMNAEARIHVERRPDALQAPIQALVDHKGKFFVLVQTGSKLETREVKVSSTNDKVAAIDTGVAENEQLVLNPRKFSELVLPSLPDVIPAGQMSTIERTAAAPAPPKSNADKGSRPSGPPTAASMLARTMENDADSDGKLSLAELANVSERMRPQLEAADLNKDGFLEKSEMLPVMAAAAKRIQAMQSGQGGALGGGGP